MKTTINNLLESFYNQSHNYREWLKENKPRNYKNELDLILNKKISSKQIGLLLQLVSEQYPEEKRIFIDDLGSCLRLSKLLKNHWDRNDVYFIVKKYGNGTRFFFYENQHLNHPDIKYHKKKLNLK